MKIDWKYLATTPGYISLKKCLISDLQSKWCTPRDKKQAYKAFRGVIARATHFAYHQQRPIHHILNEWETDRTYYWQSYYTNSNSKFNKLHTKFLKPKGIKGLRKYHKKWCHGDIKKRMCDLINEENRAKSTRTKKRWTDYQRRCRNYQRSL